MKRVPWVMSFVAGAVFTGAAHAADAKSFLDKAAAEAFLVDHKITFARHADNK